MGTRERREREKEAVRLQILEAARELARQEDWQAVTIRKVAERVEYSPSALYEYFESKNALLLELLREGFRLLGQHLWSLPATTDPLNDLLAAGDAYLRFTQQYPELYQVMHGMGGVAFGSEAAPAEARDAFQALKARVQPLLLALPEGRGPDQEVELVWATLHGLVSLDMNHRLRAQTSPGEQIQQALRYLASNWGRA